MSEIPAARPAPYAADTRARGWRFEIDMEKVKQSDTWLRAKTGEVRGALLLLWSESWQQTPCGSLPADDELVALIIDMPASKFAKHRNVLMRGWWLAEDGRLYHDTIVDRVLAMLDKRATDAERAANYRARKASRTGESAAVTGESHVTHAGVRSEFDTKHQAPDTKHQLGNTPPKPPRKRRGDGADAPTVSATQLVAEGVAEQHAKDWLTVRKTKKLPLTATAWDEVKAEAVLAGMTAAEAVHKAVVNGWGGFKAKWLLEDAPAAASSPPAQSFAERDRIAGMERWEQMTGQVHPDRAPPAKRLSDVIDEPLQTLTALGAPA